MAWLAAGKNAEVGKSVERPTKRDVGDARYLVPPAMAIHRPVRPSLSIRRHHYQEQC